MQTAASRRIVYSASGGSAAAVGHCAVEFESRFECGNLERVFAVGGHEREFDLELRPDAEEAVACSARRHVGWFFFALRLAADVQRHQEASSRTVRLNITGLPPKPDALFRLGVQPAVLSTLRADSNGWTRTGEELAYFAESTAPQSSFTFSFALNVDVGETLFVASTFPYSFSDLRRDVQRLESTAPSRCVARETLALSPRGQLPCEVISITAPESASSSAGGSIPMAERPGVLVTARVHPGEAVSSWIAKGLLEFLCSRNGDAVFLRNHFVFKVVPMLNVDGVVEGCTRNAPPSGTDLNRVWSGSKSFPAVQATKALAAQFSGERRILLFVDIHGHSRKLNAFTFGCSACPQESSGNTAMLLPRLLALYSPQSFSQSDCTANVSKSKEGTARAVMWKELGIRNSYTLEASLGGTSSSGAFSNAHFTCQQYMDLGRALGLAVKDMWAGCSMSASILAFMLSPDEMSSVQAAAAPARQRRQRKRPKTQASRKRPETRATMSRTAQVTTAPPPPQPQREPWAGVAMPPIMPTALRLASRCASRQPPLQQQQQPSARPLTVIGCSASGPLEDAEEDETGQLHQSWPAPSVSCPPIASRIPLAPPSRAFDRGRSQQLSTDFRLPTTKWK